MNLLYSILLKKVLRFEPVLNQYKNIIATIKATGSILAHPFLAHEPLILAQILAHHPPLYNRGMSQRAMSQYFGEPQ